MATYAWALNGGTLISLDGLTENTAPALQAYLTAKRSFPGHSTFTGYDGKITVSKLITHADHETTYEVVGEPYDGKAPRRIMRIR